MFETPLFFNTKPCPTSKNVLHQDVQATSLLRLAHLFFDFLLQQQTITHAPGRFPGAIRFTFFKEGQTLATRFGQTVVGTESNKYDIVGVQAHLILSVS